MWRGDVYLGGVSYLQKTIEGTRDLWRREKFQKVCRRGYDPNGNDERLRSTNAEIASTYCLSVRSMERRRPFPLLVASLRPDNVEGGSDMRVQVHELG